MSIFESLTAQPNAPNALNALQQIKANPSAVLRQRGMNVPDGMTNPQQIVQHLLNSGQISNGRLQAVMQMMGKR